MVRGKKINYPLEEGEIAKVYLAAIPEKQTGYQLARKIYGEKTVTEKGPRGGKKEKKKVRKPNKPYQLAKKHSELFHRPEEDGKKKIFSKIEPFLQKMEEKGLSLEEEKRKTVKKYLDGKFRKVVAEEYIEVDYGSPVNAYRELLTQFLKILIKPYAKNKATSAWPKIRQMLGVQGKNISKDQLDDLSEIFANGFLKSIENNPANESEIADPVMGWPSSLVTKLVRFSDTQDAVALSVHQFYEQGLLKNFFPEDYE